MTIGVNISGPGSEATQDCANILFDAYRVLGDAPNVGFHVHQLLVKGGNGVIEASLLVADVGDVAFEALLRQQETI